ncbi:MAG TPA: polysaccharide deacetylase family protein [Acidimicrobiales bacterium]|nr:polysaccharide deacetylase family protein [Acidimicrobiales bacterium]
MSGASSTRSRALRPRLRQVVSGLIAIPLSALPFVAYANLTPEGRLVRDRASVALRPPSLPELTKAELAAAISAAPKYQGPVMALAYHGIGSASDGDGGFVVSPERFAEHLAILRAAGMRAVTAAQVAAAFSGGRPLPAKAVMISFDDGRTDAMMFADPLLAEAGMVATMFVITGAAEKPGIYYASWEKLEGYARSGRWDLQSHTSGLHHEQETAAGSELPALTSLSPGESLDEYRLRVRVDLRRASTAIEGHVGRRPVAFAYPFGAYGAERTNHPGIRKVLAEEVARRYHVAFHQDDQEKVPLVSSDDARLGLRRLEVGDWSGLQLLERIRKASGRTRGLEPAPEVPLWPEMAGGEPVPVERPDSADGTTPAQSTTRPEAGSVGPSRLLPRRTVPTLPRVTAPRVTLPPAPVPPAPTVPPAAGPPAVEPLAAPAPEPTPLPSPTTAPPTTAPLPPVVTTTPAGPPTTTIGPTVPSPSCRSQGKGKNCPPDA